MPIREYLKMFAAGLVLPTIAFGLIAWNLVRPTLLLLGFQTLEQETDPSTGGFRTIAVDRSQLDELDTLVEMEFRPVGTYRDKVGIVQTIHEDLVLQHRKLPVLATVSCTSSKELYVSMYTGGQRNLFLHTSSCSSNLHQKDATLRSSIVKAGFAEDVFAEHVKHLSEWEQEGFLPADYNGIEGFARLIREFQAHPLVISMFRRVSLLVSVLSLSALIFMPVLIGSGISFLLAQLFSIQLTAILWLQCFSVVSIGG